MAARIKPSLQHKGKAVGQANRWVFTLSPPLPGPLLHPGEDASHEPVEEAHISTHEWTVRYNTYRITDQDNPVPNASGKIVTLMNGPSHRPFDSLPPRCW